MRKRSPSSQDYREYDGAHCPNLWFGTPENWRCPSCNRSKFELLRWTKRHSLPVNGKRKPYIGWLAVLHRHHDHGGHYDEHWNETGNRFPQTVICDHCNVADGMAKRKLGLAKSFSFSPQEIGRFVKATPHAGHTIDYETAREVYDLLIANWD